MDAPYNRNTVSAKVVAKPGEAQMIIPFTNPEIVVRFAFHCHVVRHEDKGMMMAIEVAR